MSSSIFKSLSKRSFSSYGGGGGGGAAIPLDRRRIASTLPLISPFSTSAASASSNQSQEKERGIWSKLFLFIPGAITFGLGTWQIFRRQDKICSLKPTG